MGQGTSSHARATAPVPFELRPRSGHHRVGADAGRTSVLAPDTERNPHMRGSGLIWTIVGILLIIALIIFIF